MPANTSVMPIAGERRTHARAADRGGEAVLHRLAIAFALQLLQGERLHRLNRVQGLAREPAGVGDAILRGARQAAHAPADDDERHDHHRNQHQHDAHEFRAGEPEHHERRRSGSRSSAR